MRPLIALVLLLMLLGEGAQAAFPNEPEGFGPLRFGASTAALEKAFPKAKRRGQEEFLTIYDLEGQSVLGLKPCTVELRFVDDKFYQVLFSCEPKDKVARALEKRFGPAVQHKPDETVWLSETHWVSFSPQAKSFSYTDRSLGSLAQKKLLGYVLRQRAQAQATAAVPTPGPTP
ncbi:MAG TPA: hypothetical protein VMW56_02780 [Candidatus Margulisiibacteriota bacterium]|nr:hypothetical protein [Candidatus Margulisiibacteriota bacterium]